MIFYHHIKVMISCLTPGTAYQKAMETLYLKTVYFQTMHTFPQKIPQLCRRGQEERRSLGYYQGGLKFSLMGRHQIWSSPLCSVLLHQGRFLEIVYWIIGLYWTIFFTHMFWQPEEGEKKSCSYNWHEQSRPWGLSFQDPLLESRG